MVKEITKIINLSLDVKIYPWSRIIAKVTAVVGTPQNPTGQWLCWQQYLESLLARQLDEFQEKHKLVNKGVHGFRRGRGTNIAMPETWEYVLAKTEKGELFAINFLDMSAGFDTMVPLYLLRKMEVETRM